MKHVLICADVAVRYSTASTLYPIFYKYHMRNNLELFLKEIDLHIKIWIDIIRSKYMVLSF